MELTSSQKGEIAKLKTEIRAMEKGWISSRTVESARYDLVLDDGKKLHRVQVKYASTPFGHCEGAVTANLRRHKGDDRNLKYRRQSMRTYNTDEIDAIIVYIPQVDKLCWFGSEHFVNKSSIHIRYKPSGNNQKGGKRVEDFQW